MSIRSIVKAITVFCVKPEQTLPMLCEPKETPFISPAHPSDYIFGLWAYTFLAFGVRSWIAVRREYLTQKYVGERVQLEGDIEKEKGRAERRSRSRSRSKVGRQ